MFFHNVFRISEEIQFKKKILFNGSQLAKMKKSIPDTYVPAIKFTGMKQLV